MSQNTSTAVMAQRVEPHEIISLDEARERGLKRYFTGKPCRKGHIAERLVSSRGCMECCRVAANPGRRESAAAYYRENAERMKEAARVRWRSSPDAKAKDKEYRDARRDEIRVYDRMRAKRDREKRKIIIEKWHKNNPGRSKALYVSIAARRRARLKSVGGSFSADDIERLKRAQKGKCWWCSSKLGDKFHVDHRFPVAKGGHNNPSNLVLSCAPCNRAKSAKMPWEFSGRLL